MKKHYTQRVIDLSMNLKEKYQDIIANSKSAFTRIRKIKLSDLFIQMLANKGQAQQSELFNFYNEVNKKMSVSATAFFNARMKFNPEALLKIMQDITKEEYTEADHLCKLNNHYIFAVDGSDFSLPATMETRSKYGTSSNHKGKNQNTVLAAVSTLYDCINELFIDVKINPFRTSEIAVAIEHMDLLKEFLPKEEKSLVVFDKNYAGIRLIDHMIESNLSFLIRVSTGRYKREREMLTKENPDQWIDVKYDATRLNHYKDDRHFYNKLSKTTYKLRFVKLFTTNSKNEPQEDYFVTNISDGDFPYESIYDLYHLRWKIETSYRALKSQMQVENYSGKRDILIRQDIYASTFVHNNISMTIAEQEKEENHPESKQSKHPQKINRNFALGILKTDLLKLFTLHKNKKEVSKAQKRYEKNISRYSCPVREGRSRPRLIIGTSKQKQSYKKSY